MNSFWRQSWAIARKELGAYFGSAMALIFVGTFLVVTLFSFFFVGKFWVRNIADVRPLFQGLPVLMIGLVAALTMRQWSEEQRSGTMEILLTLPVRKAHLVLGKFMAAMLLVVVALALTSFLPLSVSILGDLDWGPVIGGYLATLLMASTYVALGLFVSSRTDNQIVSLIVTVIIGGLLYLVGWNGVTGMFGESVTQVLRAIGTGSRFESIERGVIDLRDLIYYLSLTAFFLILNVFSVDMQRWSRGARTLAYRRNAILSVVLIGANVLALNVWMFPISRLRVDLTANQEYSLSQATRDLVSNLQEPLLIRGYFSEKTHPLLEPLVPTIRDMLREYAIASGGQITVETVDPREDEELEAEANQVYGISPTPFRVSEHYEESIINSYFDILIRYGDQSEVLNFQDLIEVESLPTGDVEVRLRNLEYDLTRTIKKTVYGFQSLDAVFAGIESEIKLTALVSWDALPSSLAEVPSLIEAVGQEIQDESRGKFNYAFIDPDAQNSPYTRQGLYDTYGIQPIPVALFSPESYYLYMILEVGQEAHVIYPTATMGKADIRSEIEAVLRRSTPGFLKTVGVWSPPETAMQDPYTGQSMQPISTFQYVREPLGQNYTIKEVDLTSGYVPGDVDVLVVVAPQGFTAKELFAIDQYLMRGGSVVVAVGNYMLSPYQYSSGLALDQIQDGVGELLAHYGVAVEPSIVMDPQNEPFPVQVQRQVGGMSVVELQQVPYPFFVDVRQDAMSKDSVIVANLPAITLHWASPLTIDEAKNEGRDVVTLLESSALSWLTTSTNTLPDLQTHPEYGFPVEGEQGARPLAVSIYGVFESYFKGQPSPFDTVPDPASPDAGVASEQRPLTQLDQSPDSARLVVIGSAEFLDDTLLQLSQQMSQDRYLNNLQLVQNAIDWAVEDEDLLSIRSRGTYVHLLKSVSTEQQRFWEGLNYAVALIGLAVIGVVWNSWRRNEEPIIAQNVDASNSPSSLGKEMPHE
ncbi:MAG: Gldg family protein [Anaerolineae bacterium]|nr:Gldg family protein [Anaerolineae bacterium]